MHPELFKIPFLHWSVWSFGVMMVIGFLSAVYIIRRLSRNITPDPQMITSAALYSLIAGVFGARVFYVIHYYQQFKGNLLSVFAIWQGGLELLGGVLLAITVIAFYLRHHKLPIRRYLDILAIALMSALAFGRIGCFLNGCCYGKPTNLPCAVRFPYGSYAYRSQVYPDLGRNRTQPQLRLRSDFFYYIEKNGQLYSELKPYEDLTPEQKNLVDNGPYQALPVHPTQLYSFVNAVISCLILYFFWRKSRTKTTRFKSGSTFALMFILYGLTRFFMEFLRDDNPFEFDSLTVSQNIAIALVIFGIGLMMVFQKLKPDKITTPKTK